MSMPPETRYSLLLRVGDPADGQAWLEFWRLYEPVVYRLGRQFGLQDADAQDLTQDVMAAVARAIPSWQPDSARGRFRTWLYTVVRNKTIAALRRRRPTDRGTADTDVFNNIEARPIGASAAFELEVRRAAFQQAAERVRPQFHVTSWEAFWQTSVLGHSIGETAKVLKISIGSVYAARSRILARLRSEAEAMLEDELE
ncbi:MAG TPA: sigma-70 family RNA polymerase sigma factor [Pirellulales bacterium]|nr:sigma-70 family RNA polymerase sigma factor [Pirellulales bacterium]